MDYFPAMKRIIYATAIIAVGGCGGNSYSQRDDTKPAASAVSRSDTGSPELSDKVSAPPLWPKSGVITCTEEDVERSTRRLCSFADPNSEFYRKLGCSGLLEAKE